MTPSRNRLTTLLEQKRRAGDRIIDLTESNPTRAGIVYPVEDVAGAFADPRIMQYHPDPAGMWAAREVVSSYYAARGVTVEPERVMLTASTSEAYAYLFKLLCEPWDEILTPRPSYPLFEYLARFERVRVRQYPLFYDHGWHVDLAELRSLISLRTRSVVVVNPNNPTGSFLKRRELVELIEICAENGLALMSDEVFSDYGFGEDGDRVATLANVEGVPAFAMSGLSKIAGLPQMKLGWIVANDHVSFERLELIADTYLSVGTPVQVAFPKLMELSGTIQKQISARTRANLEWLREAVGAAPEYRVLDVEGGWSATLQVPRVRPEEERALDLLERENVLVQPGYFYDFESEAYLVVSLLTETAAFREGLAAILRG